MPGEIWLGYAGTLGISYDLPVVFDAVRKVENPKLRFIVMGDGPLKKDFEDKAEGIKVTFVGRLPYEQMCGVLTACNMVVNPIVGSSVASIINKHADYAACGKPVLNTQRSEEYRMLIDKYQMGINCDNADEIAISLRRLSSSKELTEAYANNARRCAEECFDRDSTYKMIEELIMMGNKTNEII